MKFTQWMSVKYSKDQDHSRTVSNFRIEQWFLLTIFEINHSNLPTVIQMKSDISIFNCTNRIHVRYNIKKVREDEAQIFVFLNINTQVSKSQKCHRLTSLNLMN